MATFKPHERFRVLMGDGVPTGEVQGSPGLRLDSFVVRVNGATIEIGARFR